VERYEVTTTGTLDLKRQPNGNYSVSRSTTTPGRTGSAVVELDSSFNPVASHETVGPAGGLQRRAGGREQHRQPGERVAGADHRGERSARPRWLAPGRELGDVEQRRRLPGGEDAVGHGE
jgi:hypothetical protein